MYTGYPLSFYVVGATYHFCMLIKCVPRVLRFLYIPVFLTIGYESIIVN